VGNVLIALLLVQQRRCFEPLHHIEQFPDGAEVFKKALALLRRPQRQNGPVKSICGICVEQSHGVASFAALKYFIMLTH
jgi:hypothetical protein